MPKSEQGVTNDRYIIIPRTLIFVLNGENILLLRGAPHKRLWGNRYNGIGGHVERGEDILSAARRELAEESGIVSTDMRLVGVVMIDADERRGIGLYVFKGNYNGDDLQESSEGKLEWVPVARLFEYDLVEDLMTILPRILNMSSDTPPFSALYDYDADDKMCIHFSE